MPKPTAVLKIWILMPRSSVAVSLASTYCID